MLQASHAIRGNEGGWRFRVLSYNVLADCLAQEHKELYTSAPRFSLEWSFRSRLIIRCKVAAWRNPLETGCCWRA